VSRRPSLPTQGVIWKYTLAALAGLILAYAVAGYVMEGSILPGVAGVAAGGEPAEEAGAAETSSLEARVIASMQVPEADLLELASARVDEVRALLLGTGRLQADRIADAEPVVLERAPRGGGGVRLSLDAL
jgi:hypothetical protein